ncbi:hypothetical protein J2X63_002274 [Agromyces sp. 3263]|uniref:hypothetical protein n=1 Tax=Agromyces sp. 3263 TaxID=2817750 RepID=UPI00285DD0AD|nr:hypothetical protein [Agromyces sp. 3263]MDR6906588.1 hypothetical protein [Agromyces sp. 3263]
MDRIHYAGDSVVTGSEIARAVLEYAKALAKANQSATVEIPTLAPDGSISRSTLLIGPASQLIADAEEEADGEEIVDDELVGYFHAETAKLTQHAYPARANETSDPAWMDEL